MNKITGNEPAMPLSELRIGNFLSCLDDEFNGLVKIQSINQWTKRVGVENHTGTYKELPYRLLNPIPLTPDILEKSGFRNVQGDYWIKDADLMLVLDSVWWWTNVWVGDAEFRFDTLAPYREIESLHQLQNLYFALTGKELEVKL